MHQGLDRDLVDSALEAEAYWNHQHILELHQKTHPILKLDDSLFEFVRNDMPFKNKILKDFFKKEKNTKIEFSSSAKVFSIIKYEWRDESVVSSHEILMNSNLKKNINK